MFQTMDLRTPGAAIGHSLSDTQRFSSRNNIGPGQCSRVPRGMLAEQGDRKGGRASQQGLLTTTSYSSHEDPDSALRVLPLPCSFSREEAGLLDPLRLGLYSFSIKHILSSKPYQNGSQAHSLFLGHNCGHISSIKKPEL